MLRFSTKLQINKSIAVRLKTAGETPGYDTIRDAILTCAQKLTSRNQQLNSGKKEKKKTKKPKNGYAKEYR